ncbi:MAG TPA: HD domain-containing protein [Vicinamibacterales bacterium]|nr:HD domain-containing protein [Vicinamibacterales bacterium]
MNGRTLTAINQSERTWRLTAAFLETGVGSTAALEGLLSRLYRRDGEALAHLHRVADLASKIGEELGMPAEQMADLERAALLHDIGRLAVPDPPALAATRQDASTLERRAAQLGVACEVAADIAFLAPAAAILAASVECFDGTGFPEGRRGDDIPLAARVLHLADTLDALNAICEALAAPAETASAELVRQAGSRFDPEVVAAWLRCEEDVPPPLVPWWSSAARMN